MNQPNYGPFTYHPGQDVQARQNNNWVPAHIINPNTDGTYDIVIGRQPYFGWSANNIRRDPNDTRQRGPFNIPQPSFITTDLLNGYGAQWMEQRGDEADNFSPEIRIHDFLNFVRESIGNRILTQAEEQMIENYANENINAVFDWGNDNYNTPQTGGAKKRRHRRSVKKNKKRRTKRRRQTKRR
jgi:hypothetical protein